MDAPAELLGRASRLPEFERAEIACRLLLSVDPERVPAGLEERWIGAIESRLRTIDEARADGIPWDELRARIRRPGAA